MAVFFERGEADEEEASECFTDRSKPDFSMIVAFLDIEYVGVFENMRGDFEANAVFAPVRFRLSRVPFEPDVVHGCPSIAIFNLSVHG
ncbi:MAG TPA: hypothetical protein VMF58_06650 [Rhizomicrobium sp.]|nr:hypothetical protein [Rhizomicrobium sp.]